jgi:hypothetical protein
MFVLFHPSEEYVESSISHVGAVSFTQLLLRVSSFKESEDNCFLNTSLVGPVLKPSQKCLMFLLKLAELSPSIWPAFESS